ncbi:tetratricopeptide repeat protein [Deefgea rivuli]|uniref:tetratricopeptide repeat protein n=1 Tax=Deefgea rivuli TaxID=400948 RepID=UPI000488E093|nr:tetratricopeptide repeat protein [Deefgea rivuli]
MIERSEAEWIEIGNEITRLADIDWEAALAAAKHMLSEAQSGQQPRQIALAMQTEARVLKRLPDKTPSIRQQNEVIRYLKREQLSTHLATAYRQLGQMQYDAMAYFKALDAWLKSLELAGQEQNIHDTTLAYVGIGKFYYAVGEYTRAMHYHQLALLAAKPLQQAALDAEININIAADAFRLHDFSAVEVALNRAQQALETGYDRPVWMGEITFYRGMICFEQSQFADAQEFLSRAYNIYRKNHNSWGEGHVLLALGRTFIKLNEPEHAAECLSTACEISEQHQLLALGIEAHEILAFLYIEQGDNALALQFHKRLHELICQNLPEQNTGLRLSRHAAQRLHDIEGAFDLAKIHARLAV